MSTRKNTRAQSEVSPFPFGSITFDNVNDVVEALANAVVAEHGSDATKWAFPLVADLLRNSIEEKEFVHLCAALVSSEKGRKITLANILQDVCTLISKTANTSSRVMLVTYVPRTLLSLLRPVIPMTADVVTQELDRYILALSSSLISAVANMYASIPSVSRNDFIIAMANESEALIDVTKAHVMKLAEVCDVLIRKQNLSQRQ